MRTSVLWAVLAMGSYFSGPAWGQSNHSNPWAPTEVGPLPPIASVTSGVWLKGDLHVHSRHSKETSNNSEAKIIGFSESAGIDYLLHLRSR